MFRPPSTSRFDILTCFRHFPVNAYLFASIRMFPYLFWVPGTSFRHPHVFPTFSGQCICFRVTRKLFRSIRRFPYPFWAPDTSFRQPRVSFDIFRSMRNFPRQSETFPVDAYLTRTVPVDTKNPTFVQLPGECRQLPAAVRRSTDRTPPADTRGVTDVSRRRLPSTTRRARPPRSMYRLVVSAPSGQSAKRTPGRLVTASRGRYGM